MISIDKRVIMESIGSFLALRKHGPIGFILIFLLIFCNVQAQEQKKVEVMGYIKDIQNVFIPKPDSMYWLSDNTLENRIQLKYYPQSWLTADVQVRNRFMYGDFVKSIPNYRGYIDQHMGFFDLSAMWGDNKSFIAYSEIDRLNLLFNINKWQITVGRQRVNWGIDLIWNPNDIFNTYSYFNFEYAERPGADAVSVKYYTNATSFVEAVYQMDKTFDQSSIGGLYRFNTHEYDIQFLGGKMKTDFVVGLGWSGNVGKAAFRGETSYFRDYKEFSDSVGVLVSSISMDYSFSNTLYLQGGFLFNSSGATKDVAAVDLFSQQVASPKTLSKGKYNLFAQATGQLTPLVSPGIAIMFNPSDKSTFISPSVTLSVTENFDFSAVGILFLGKENTEYQNIGQLVYIKFKWNF
ncbi:MAG TPA: hypothetical protein DIW31_06465 [Bacteroidales bacterium]|nr:hypothetical protein [Bacteroidales bacterium]